MWISKVDDIVSSEDSVQVNSPLTGGGNRNFFRTPLSNTNRSARMIGLSELTRDSSAVVTFSQASVKQSATSAASLAGVDINLFSAD